MARKKNVQQSNRKSYRQRMGYTQQQISDILGVSRRSVIRYEKGQVKSGKAFDKLSQFYRNAVELNENIKDKSEKALERYKELSKEITAQGDAPSVVQRYYENYLSDINNRVKGKNLDELKKLDKKLDKFLSWKTSTPEGYKEWKENVKKSSMKTSGEKSVGHEIGDDYGTGNVGYWKLYSRIRSNNSWRQVVKEMYDATMSISEAIQQFITNYRAKGLGFRAIEKIIEKEVRARLVEENEETMATFRIKKR